MIVCALGRGERGSQCSVCGWKMGRNDNGSRETQQAGHEQA
jgi:hypothetical protein